MGYRVDDDYMEIYFGVYRTFISDAVTVHQGINLCNIKVSKRLPVP